MITSVSRAPAQGPLARALRLVRQLWRNRRDRRFLMTMSDSLLADLGLARGDIERELARPLHEPVRWQELQAIRQRAGRPFR
ncbi:DUF1127 domain-containing protein [Marinimicrococcus flavescens]|uniref:DUF1127 domain-containing protein n=1 Tax=Marinimicrococcus flavescens TaxID=3031815 RepID=A0AAP3V197_9PROT|nr:DUF1127 domain-containing protein [Marinimicrococcus flavescens]